jgi:hypothetical protein
MKMYTKDGSEMMDLKEVHREGSNLVIKGKIMQSINTSIYLKPIDAWRAKSLLSWGLIFYLPIIFFKGWLASFKDRK